MVSGTGERTIATWAALTLVVGLALSAAPAAYSATETATVEPSDTASQTTLEESGGEDTSPSATGEETSTESSTPSTSPTPTGDPTQTGNPTGGSTGDPDPPPPPTGSPEPEPTEPTGPTNPNGPDTSEPEAPPEPEFFCDGGLVAPGEVVETTCTVPNGLKLSIPHPHSSTGGNARVSGNTIIYTAPENVNDPVPDPFTVHADGPDGTLETQVTFNIQGSPNGDPTPTVTEPPAGPEPTGTPDATGTASAPPTSTTTSPTEELPLDPQNPDEGSVEAPGFMPPPGAPGDSSVEPSPSMFPHLPIPGMPHPGSQNITPEPTADASEDSSDRGTDDSAGPSDPEDDEGLLAQTGPEQVAWSGSLAASAIVLGITALALSHRQPQRSSGPR